IVSADFFNISFARYAAVMVPVNFVSVAATLLVLLLYFRRSIPVRYDDSQLKEPKEAIRDLATFRAGWVVLGLLLISFFTLEGFGVPVSSIAALGAITPLIVAGHRRKISTRKVVREAPCPIGIFYLRMYLLVYGLRNAGLTEMIARLL